MQNLHNKLLERSKAYAKWHNGSMHKVVHWLALVLIATFATWFLAGQISQYQLASEENVASVGQSTVHGHSGISDLPPAQDHILVKFKNNIGQAKKAEVLAKHDLSEISEIKQIGVKIVKIKDTETPEEVVQNLLADEGSNIQFAEVDQIIVPAGIPNDPYYPQQWHLSDVSLPAAWDISTGTPGIIIADPNTGVDWNHPDLAPSLIIGWNVVTNTTNTQDVAACSLGHGTAVAGTLAAATNNGIGVSGVSWNNKIMPIVIVDSNCTAYVSALTSAITWAADHGAKVINMSWLGSSFSSAEQSAVNYAWNKGLVLTASAGDDNETVGYPADDQNVLGISGISQSDTFYSGSGYGNGIDLSAPYYPILTTDRGGVYDTWYGTCFSSPIVAGVAALMFSAKPSLTNSQVVSLLESNADDLGTPGWDQYYGYGKVNAAKALAAVGQVATDTIPPTAPTNLSATAPASNQVNLSWSASTDNVGVAGYNVFRNGSKVATVSNPSYTDNSVVGSTSYSYQVYAYDTSNNVSSSSNTATVTTPTAVVKLSMTSFQVSAKTATTATVKWTTNIPSTGTVSYGLSKTNLNSQISDNTVGTSHTVNLSGLSNKTTYYYKINATSQDSTQSVVSSISSFKTNPK